MGNGYRDLPYAAQGILRSSGAGVKEANMLESTSWHRRSRFPCARYSSLTHGRYKASIRL